MRPQPITSRPIRSAASVFIIALIIGISFVYLFTKQAIEQKKERALIIAIGHADELQNHLLQTLSVTDALAALVRHENGNIANFEALASEILHQYPGADAIALEPNGVIEHIYPKEGNAQAIGLNLLEAAGRKTEAVQARDSKKLTLAGPFDLVQGGIGILGFRPVFLENASGETTFWGFTNVVMHLPEALCNGQVFSERI
jgi:sensor domain CHASE-containing protein